MTVERGVVSIVVVVIVIVFVIDTVVAAVVIAVITIVGHFIVTIASATAFTRTPHPLTPTIIRRHDDHNMGHDLEANVLLAKGLVAHLPPAHTHAQTLPQYTRPS